MLKFKNNNSQGFTIIEVLIVLAIAALILLIVFLAVPQLNNNFHDYQKKRDISRLIIDLSSYYDSNGSYPEMTDSCLSATESYSCISYGAHKTDKCYPGSATYSTCTTGDETNGGYAFFKSEADQSSYYKNIDTYGWAREVNGGYPYLQNYDLTWIGLGLVNCNGALNGSTSRYNDSNFSHNGDPTGVCNGTNHFYNIRGNWLPDPINDTIFINNKARCLPNDHITFVGNIIGTPYASDIAIVYHISSGYQCMDIIK